MKFAAYPKNPVWGKLEFKYDGSTRVNPKYQIPNPKKTLKFQFSK